MSIYSDLNRVAADIKEVREQVKAISNAPQSQRTSVEGGSIDFNDNDGNLKAIVGGQEDGGTTVNVIAGPTPPTPANFTVTVDHGSLTVHWDGEFENDAVAPTDWARWTAYAQEGLFVVPERSTAIGGTDSASGGEVTAGVLKGQWTVTVLAWSQAGKPSAMGLPVTVEVPGYGEIVLAEIDAAETLIKNAGEILVTEQGTLDEKLTEVDGTLDNLGQDLEAVEAAQEALSGDLTDVMLSIDGKNTIKWDPAAPTSATPGKAAGDLWYRTSGNSIIGFWKWSGTDWVAQLLDKTTIPLIDIGAGTFGTMSGTRLQAGTVSTSMLSVGVGGNLLPDPKFLDPAMSAIRAGTQWTYKTVSGETCFERVMPNPGSTANLPLTDKMGNEYYLPAAPGVKNVLELDVSGPVSMYLYFYMSDGSLSAPGTSIQNNLSPTSRRIARFVLEPDLYATSTAVVERFSVRVRQTSSSTTAPPGTLTRVFSARVSPMSGSTVIEGGAISTDKLSANVLEVGNLKAGTAAIQEAVVNKLWAEAVVAKMVTATEFIGENAILTGAVTAPKITASEELWAKIGEFVKIRAEQIQADAIDGMVVTGATFRTSGGSGSWSDAGLFIAQPDGTSMVSFPTDGSPLSLTASDVQIDRASITDLDVSGGAVRSGGALTLASGVTAPASPPELTTGWQKSASLQTPDVALAYDWLGLGYWSSGAGYWVRAVNVLGSEGDSQDTIEVYALDGTFHTAFATGLNPRAGVTVIGDVAYVMGPDYEKANIGKQWVHGFNLNNGARVSRWGMPYFFASNQKKIAIGNDGTNILVAGVAPNGTLSVFRLNASTGALVGSIMSDAGWNLSVRDVNGVGQSGSDLFLTHTNATRVYTPSGSTLTRKADSQNPSGWAGWLYDGVQGMEMVGGSPHIVSGSGDVYAGSAFASDTTVQSRYTWFNGSNETTPSPVAVTTVNARNSLTVSMAKRAGLQKRLYVRAGTSGDWNRVTVGESVTSLAVSGLGSGGVWGTLFPLPTVNTFPNATPAVLRSANGNIEFKGDGSGKIGPLTFNSDGTMTSTQIPAWVPITSFASGFGPQTWGFAPAYRVWPDGKVEWRGIVTGAAMAAGQVDPFTIPVNARPTQFVQFAAASTSGLNLKRVEFRPAGETDGPNAFRVYHGGVSGAWVSLDGIFYYKS